MRHSRFSNRNGWVLGCMMGLLFFCHETRADFVFGKPEKVPHVNSDFSDGSPHISRNGLELYLSSRRGGDMYRLWVSKRTTTREAWSVPVPLEAPVYAGSEQIFPSLSADGLELYYADGEYRTPDPAGHGNSDLWVLTRASITDPWGIPTNLGPTINSPDVESSPCISADGLELYFAYSAQGRPGYSDIVVATRPSKEDPWGTPVVLGTNVNTSASFEYNPFISMDGLSLFFSRGGGRHDIYVCRRAARTDPWGAAQYFEPVNYYQGSIHCVSYSSEESAIYFQSGTNIFATDFNIYRVEVTPIVDWNADDAVDPLDAYTLLENWGPTRNGLYDIAPMPFGDGVVNALDLKVLAEHMLAYENIPDINDLP